jgi:hypothetical protein
VEGKGGRTRLSGPGVDSTRRLAKPRNAPESRPTSTSGSRRTQPACDLSQGFTHTRCEK